MNKIIKKLIVPFKFKENTEGLNWKGKLIAILYFPSILVMWYGYYMWKDANDMGEEQ